MTHQELIAALEKATGPDREIDVQIYRAEFPHVACHFPQTKRDALDLKEAPAYTVSIDAAMTLVPEGWYCVGVLRDNEGEWVPRLHQNKRGLLSAHANHPRLSIALCIAALRARALNSKDET